MACREWVPAYGAPGVGVIYADASGEEGWAAWTFASGVVYMVSGVWGPLDRDLIIADKELVASTVGLFVLGEALQFLYVWEYTDNTGASRHATTVELALASLSWSGAQERAQPWQAPTSRPLQVCIGKVSVPLTALVRRRRFPRSRVDVALHAISVHFRVWRVCTHPCSGSPRRSSPKGGQ